MAKYEGWTLGETEAILNVIGGTDIARAVLRGERKLTVEDIVKQQPAPKPLLVGTVVKTLRLAPYQVKSLAEAIKLGKYSDHNSDIPRLFAGDELGLTEAMNVDLVQFDRDPYYDEMIAWAKANGDKQPILPKHIHAIGIQHPEEQRNAPIVELGSVQDGHVLCLDGASGWRYLGLGMVGGRWSRFCLFGFVGSVSK